MFEKTEKCGISSVGRAIPCQGIGREFEPLIPLQFPKEAQRCASFFHFRGDLAFMGVRARNSLPSWCFWRLSCRQGLSSIGVRRCNLAQEPPLDNPYELPE